METSSPLKPPSESSETIEKSIQEIMQTNFEYSKTIINELLTDDSVANVEIKKRIKDLESQLVLYESNFDKLQNYVNGIKQVQVQQDLDMRELVRIILELQKMVNKFVPQ